MNHVTVRTVTEASLGRACPNCYQRLTSRQRGVRPNRRLGTCEMTGNRLRPVAGKDRNPAHGRFRQGAGQPGEPLPRDRLGSGHGSAYAVAGLGADRACCGAQPGPARSPRCGPARGNRCGEPLRRTGARRQALATAGPAEVAGGCSRRQERRGWHASRWGSRPRRMARGGAGCGTGLRRPVGAGHRGLGAAWSAAGFLVTC